MDKIIRVKEPETDPLGRKGLYIVTYKDDKGGEWDAHMSEEQYQVKMIKDKLIKKGYDPKDLDEYEDALSDYFRFNEAMNLG